MAQVYENMLDIRQLVKGVIMPPFENPPIESELSPEEGLIIKHFSGNNKPEKRKKYLKKYLKEYFKDKKRKELIFTKREYSFLKKMAKHHKQKVGSFAKDCIFYYLEKKYIVPDNDILNELQIGIRAIGNNINQIAKHANTTRTFGVFNASRINNELEKLEGEINAALKQPLDLLSVVAESIKGNPEMIYQIELLIFNSKTSE